jgi:hypothetical protein
LLYWYFTGTKVQLLTEVADLEELCAHLAPLAVDRRDHKAASFLCSLDASFAVSYYCMRP